MGASSARRDRDRLAASFGLSDECHAILTQLCATVIAVDEHAEVEKERARAPSIIPPATIVTSFASGSSTMVIVDY